MSESAEHNVRVVIATDFGSIVLQIDVAAAPITAHNFLRYVTGGLFDGSSFFRIATSQNQPDQAVKIDVIQGGLSVDPPSPFPPIEHEPTSRTGLSHRDGTVSMARRGVGTAAASFFICIGDQPELDHGGRRYPDGQGFAAFGRVIEGLDVVRAIWARAEPEPWLKETIAIRSVTALLERAL